MDVTFRFAIGAEVQMKLPVISGRVIGLMIDEAGSQWAYVEYATREGELIHQWMLESTLSG